MAPDYRHITQAELAVLQALWETQPATTRQLTERLYARRSVSEYYTVQKLLERLEEKGCVRRDRSGRAHRFRALVDREQLLGERLLELSDKYCDGAMIPMLTELVRLRKLTRPELDALKRLVDELEQESRR